VRGGHRPLDLGIGPSIDDGLYKGIGRDHPNKAAAIRGFTLTASQKGRAVTAVVKATEIMIAKP